MYSQAVWMCANCSHFSFCNFNFVSVSYYFFRSLIFFFVQCDFSTKFSFLFFLHPLNVCTMVSCSLHVYHIAIEREYEEEEEEEIWCRSVNWGRHWTHTLFFLLLHTRDILRESVCKRANQRVSERLSMYENFCACIHSFIATFNPIHFTV